MGSIDCDPASNELAQRTIRATRWFSRDSDGLQQEWTGNVWCNPPYGRGLIDAFVEKLIEERSRFNQAIVLTHSRTDSQWFHRLCGVSQVVGFTRGRINFTNSAQVRSAPPEGSVFAYLGPVGARFCDVFGDACLCLVCGAGR
jgi:hypothetical protein